MQKKEITVYDSNTGAVTTFKGKHLDVAVKRAKRYIRALGDLRKPPSHIEQALAVFLELDRAGFEQCVREAIKNGPHA